MKIKTLFALFTVLSLTCTAYANEAMELKQPDIIQAQITKTHAEELAGKCKVSGFSKIDGDYILGPGDVFSINFTHAPEISKDSIHVQPDGKIILDVFNEPLLVEGMTLTQLYCVLTSAYDKVLQDPHLTLNLVSTKPYVVYVTGSVLRPGSYEVNTQVSKNPMPGSEGIPIARTTPLLSNVLAAAGGVSYFADLQNITIENKKLNKPPTTINLLKLLKEGDAGQDIRLVEGDVIHVPRNNTVISDTDYRVYASSSFSPKNVPVRVFGYVNQPGLVSLDTAQSLNLLSAITAAGGYQSNSAYSPNKVYIFRRVNDEGRMVRFEVNPKTKDITLFPNDTVYVPLNQAARAGLFFDYISRMLNPAVRSAATYKGFTGTPLFNTP